MAAAADGVVPTKGEEGPGRAESGGEEKKPLPEFSLGFLSQTHPVRAVAINWIRSKWFYQSIIGLIVAELHSAGEEEEQVPPHGRGGPEPLLRCLRAGDRAGLASRRPARGVGRAERADWTNGGGGDPPISILGGHDFCHRRRSSRQPPGASAPASSSQQYM